MKLKKILIAIVMIPMIFMSGCWSSREINTLSVSICIGIDKTEDGYMVTHQALNPKAIASKKATSEAPVVLYSDTGKDIFEIFRKLTEQSPRRMYLSHLRMVVLSEEVAKEGINAILDFFARDHELRTDFYFIIAKGTSANSVLSILTPIESISGLEMFDSLETSEKSWAPTKSVRIIELMNNIVADGKNPVLPGITITDGIINSNSTDALKQSNDTKKLKFTSLGAFKKDRLTGWLNEEESKVYNYITGNVKGTVAYVEYGDKVKITFEVLSAGSVIKASLINGKPAVDVKISIKQKVGAVEGNFDVSKQENKKILNEISEKKVKLICEKTLNKVQKEFKTDIFGFGEVIHRENPKLWEEIKDNWDNVFPELPVNLTVRVETKQLGQVTKPFYIKEK